VTSTRICPDPGLTPRSPRPRLSRTSGQPDQRKFSGVATLKLTIAVLFGLVGPSCRTRSISFAGPGADVDGRLGVGEVRICEETEKMENESQKGP